MACRFDNISQGQQTYDGSSVLQLFKGGDPKEIQRLNGEIDALIGFNYGSLHPTMVQCLDNLILMENRFKLSSAICTHTRIRFIQIFSFEHHRHCC